MLHRVHYEITLVIYHMLKLQQYLFPLRQNYNITDTLIHCGDFVADFHSSVLSASKKYYTS